MESAESDPAAPLNSSSADVGKDTSDREIDLRELALELESNNYDLNSLSADERLAVLAEISHLPNAMSVPAIMWWEEEPISYAPLIRTTVNIPSEEPIDVNIPLKKNLELFHKNMETIRGCADLFQSAIVAEPLSPSSCQRELPAVAYQVLGLLFGYTAMMRTFNGDWRGRVADSMQVFLDWTPVMDTKYRPLAMSDAVQQWIALRPLAIGSDRINAMRIVLKDCKAICASPQRLRYAVLDVWIICSIFAEFCDETAFSFCCSGLMPNHSVVLPLLTSFHTNVYLKAAKRKADRIAEALILRKVHHLFIQTGPHCDGLRSELERYIIELGDISSSR